MRFILGSLLLLSFSTVQAAQITKTTFSFPGRVEIHVQPSVNELDVLFVIDDSASMEIHQNNLIKNIPVLAKSVLKQGVHVHAGVTTTSFEECGFGRACKGKFNGKTVDSDSADFLTALSANLTVGTTGSGIEMPLDSAVAAMTDAVAQKDHPEFYRPNAHLALIFLTDADDQSSQHSPETFASFFKGLKAGPERISVNSIQTSPQNECSSEPVGPKLATAVGLMSGKTYNICAPDYASQLGQISSDIVRKVTREIPLTTAPDVNSIVVKYGSTTFAKGDLRYGWSYDSVNNTVVLGDLIDWSALEGDELVVSFIPKDWK